MTNPDEEEYSGFKTLGTDIDEAYSMMGDDDLDDWDFEDED
jgi:hypothetical protein